MLNLSKMKKSEVKASWIISGQKVVLRNPNKEQEKLISDLIMGNVEKDKKNDSQINISVPKNDVKLYRSLFTELVEGIELPIDDESFMDVINNPNDDLKKIIDGFYDIIKEASLEQMKRDIRKIDEVEAQMELVRGLNQLDELTKKYNLEKKVSSISVNGEKPIKLIDGKKDENSKSDKVKKTEKKKRTRKTKDKKIEDSKDKIDNKAIENKDDKIVEIKKDNKAIEYKKDENIKTVNINEIKNNG